MVYDSRSTGEGGNRGIDTDFFRKAPKGKFRIIFVDTFDGTDWIGGDLDTLKLAKEKVKEDTKGEQMLKAHIYDDRGCHVGEGGSF